MIDIAEDRDGCYQATIGKFKSLKYGSREGALTCLVEVLHSAIERGIVDGRHRRAEDAKPKSCPACEGWGAPTGCRFCGIYCMGG